MSGFTDIHHHLLYGLDDGPKTRDQMFAMLENAAADGIDRIVATPHAIPGLRPFAADQYQHALDEARKYCLERGLNLTILPGAELLYTDQTCRFLQEGRIPTLADTEFVLVEFSPDEDFGRIYSGLKDLLCAGYLPVLAHVERYRCLSGRFSLALRLRRELEVYYQVNCSGILGDEGGRERRFIRKLLDAELVDFVATDAHNLRTRPVRMRDAWQVLKKKYGAEYVDWLTGGTMLFGEAVTEE